MKKLIIALIGLTFLSGQLSAQLGKFPGDITKIYGQSIKDGKTNNGFFQTFAKDGLRIKVFFVNGKSKIIEAYKLKDSGGIVKYMPLTDDEITKFLTKNCADGKKWIEQVRKTGYVRRWQREDNKVSANYNFTSKLLTVKLGKAKSSSYSSNSDSSDNDKDWTPMQFSLAGSAMLPPKSKVKGCKWFFPISSSHSKVEGWDAGVFASLSPSVYGFQSSMVNVNDSCEGAQAAIVNVCGKDEKGVTGVQFGLVNYATNMDGMQFGLLNFIKNGQIKFMPFFNFNFPEDDRD